MTRSQLRRLYCLTTRASAALVPLNADGEGRDSHGGKIANPDAVLRDACAALVEAGRLAAEHLDEAQRRQVGEGCSL